MVEDSVVSESVVLESDKPESAVIEKPTKGFRAREPSQSNKREKIPRNLSTRMKAYELFSAGVRKSDVARELGVNKTAISRWCREDRWDDRMANLVRKAETTADLAVGDQVTAVLITLRNKLARRVEQLEYLCASDKPATKLAAIALWFKLAGVKQVIPNPTKPDTPASLELIQDLIEEPPSVGDPFRNPSEPPG